MSKRLFIGLELPGSVRLELAELNPRIRNVRWTASEQMHLTMSFLEEVDPEQEETLCENLAHVPVPPFFLPIRGVGTFGGAQPKILWAGVGQGHPHLFALHQHLQDAVLRAGIEPNLKPFHPHITLARLQGVSREVLKPFLRQHADTEFDLCRIEGFTLFSSKLHPEGSRYTVELRHPQAAVTI